MQVKIKKDVQFYISDYSLERNTLRLDYNGGYISIPIGLSQLQKFRENNNLNPIKYKLPKNLDEIYSSRMGREYESDGFSYMTNEVGLKYDFIENENQFLYSSLTKKQYPIERARIIEVPEDFYNIGYFFVIDSNIHPINKLNEYYNGSSEKSISNLFYGLEFNIDEIDGIWGLDICQGEEYFDEEEFSVVMNSVLGIEFKDLDEAVFNLVNDSMSNIQLIEDEASIIDVLLEDGFGSFFSVKSNIIEIVF